MATTLTEILATAQLAIGAVYRLDGTPWVPKEGPEASEEMNAADADGGFTFEFPEDRRTLRATGIGAIQVVQRRVHLMLHRMAAGDVSLEMAQLDDDARSVADAVELATYPAGTELALVESQRIEAFSPGFIRARLVVQFQFQAQYGEAA